MDFSFLFGLATSGSGLLFGKFRKGGAKEAWQAAAENYGLLHKPASFLSGPKLTGSLFGNDLTVDLKNRGTASEATRFRLSMPSRNLGLRVKKKGFWNSLGPRIVAGDKAFDNQVVVNGRRELAVREFLTRDRRKAIQGFLGAFKGAVVTDDEISLTTKGYVKNSADMLGAIDAMIQVASVLTAEPSTSVGRSEAVTAAAIVPAAAAVARAVTAGAVEPERTIPEIEPEPELQPEPQLADTEATAPAADEPPAEEPVDLLEPVEPESEAVSRSESPELPPALPGVEEFCATVFAPGALSFVANQRFKESYAGKRIAWTGTLESLTPYAFDFDFGSGRGIKAVLTILAGEAAGARKVQAVIGLPPGVEGFDDRIGQPVAFSGRLLKVDGLAKRVVIADAELRPTRC